jgi:hypothetical protein
VGRDRRLEVFACGAALLAVLAVLGCSSAETHPPALSGCAVSSECVDPGVAGSSADAGNTSSCGVDPNASECSQCANRSCCSTLAACATSTACINLFNCEESCFTSTCLNACTNQFPSGVAALNALGACESVECPVCTQLGTGDPCSPQGEACNPGLSCQGEWCTRVCGSDSDCTGLGAAGGNGQDQPNACIAVPNGTECVPGCTTDAECAAFPGTYCFGTTSLSSVAVSVCTHVPDAGGD